MSNKFNYTEEDKKRIFSDAKNVILDCVKGFKVEENNKSIEGCLKKLISLVDAVACFRAIDVIFFNGENPDIGMCEAIAEKCLEKTLELVKSK